MHRRRDNICRGHDGPGAGRVSRRLRIRVAAWLRDVRGVAAIEFALVAPIFATVLVGMTELGLALRTRLAAEAAVAAGAQAALKGFDAAVITTAVQGANPTRTVTAYPAPSAFYACPTASGLTRVAQNATCSDTKAARHFVDIYAKITRPTVFGSQFGLPATLTAHATARTP